MALQAPVAGSLQLLFTQGNMKQHQMTHKFREPGDEQPPSVLGLATSPGEHLPSSPLTSPLSSELSPPYRGEKRPGEEAPSLQPEKRAILCG